MIARFGHDIAETQSVRRTLRQMRWTNTMIKNLSPQILTSP
ncbi:hypothetical protein [Streptomyces sp. BK208]|nr:hypothetical protein [Streptomyces sp. BK208]